MALHGPAGNADGAARVDGGVDADVSGSGDSRPMSKRSAQKPVKISTLRVQQAVTIPDSGNSCDACPSFDAHVTAITWICRCIDAAIPRRQGFPEFRRAPCLREDRGHRVMSPPTGDTRRHDKGDDFPAPSCEQRGSGP